MWSTFTKDDLETLNYVVSQHILYNYDYKVPITTYDILYDFSSGQIVDMIQKYEQGELIRY